MERVFFFVGEVGDKIGATGLVLVGTVGTLLAICGTIAYLTV